MITRLLTTIPYVGVAIEQWLWGGYAVGGATLTRFFAFHFILPIAIRAMVLVHISYLHQTGSRNPSGIEPQKFAFSPLFALKDALGFTIIILFILLISLLEPGLLGDPENFNQANAIITPLHIQPEWYYLFAYAILRSIPNKLGGVLALAISVIVLYIIPFSIHKEFKSFQFYPIRKVIFWVFIAVAALLT